MLADDPRIDKNSNTGGVPASKFSLKEVTIELGGKSPLILRSSQDSILHDVLNRYCRSCGES